MDAVKLPLPAVLAGRSGEIESREVDRFSTVVSVQRDEAVNVSRTTFWRNGLNIERINDAVLVLPVPDSKQSLKKSVKVARSNSGSYKRSRLAQCEASVTENGSGDLTGKLKDLGSFDAKSNVADKTQSSKQKNNINGKRSEKRNGKVPKTKCDSFCVKAGLVSFSSAAGGNNILGLYGLKTDVGDVTKQFDEPLLNELLDGSYKSSTNIAREKGKQSENLDESNIMRSFREACSVLRPKKSVELLDYAGIDSDQAETQFADLISREKVQDPRTTSSDTADQKLLRPKDILERLSLPSAKDLDILLIDSKISSGLKSSLDPRVSKPISNRSGLQSFSWSQSSANHCRSLNNNSESVKLSTSSRHTCIGKWVKMCNPNSSSVDPASTSFLSGFESLSYDPQLVPLKSQKHDPKGYVNGSSSSLIYPKPAEQCPKLLTAAQILVEISTQSPKQNSNEIRRWPKKPSQKSMRACSYKPNEKPGYVFALPKPKPSSLLNNAYNSQISSKKPKLSVNDNKHIQSEDNLSKWSTKTRYHNHHNHNNATGLKKPCMMPPPPRVLNKPSNNQKVRKLGSMDWSKMN